MKPKNIYRLGFIIKEYWVSYLNNSNNKKQYEHLIETLSRRVGKQFSMTNNRRP